MELTELILSSHSYKACVQRRESDERKDLPLTKEFYELICEEPSFKRALEDLDITEEDQQQLFDTLDVADQQEITLKEFLNGIKEWRGGPRRTDVMYLKAHARFLTNKMMM